MKLGNTRPVLNYRTYRTLTEALQDYTRPELVEFCKLGPAPLWCGELRADYTPPAPHAPSSAMIVNPQPAPVAAPAPSKPPLSYYSFRTLAEAMAHYSRPEIETYCKLGPAPLWCGELIAPYKPPTIAPSAAMITNAPTPQNFAPVSAPQPAPVNLPVITPTGDIVAGPVSPAAVQASVDAQNNLTTQPAPVLPVTFFDPYLSSETETETAPATASKIPPSLLFSILAFILFKG